MRFCLWDMIIFFQAYIAILFARVINVPDIRELVLLFLF
jgi:hypothetical protein